MEISLMKLCKHPSILQLEEVYYYNGFISLILEPMKCNLTQIAKNEAPNIPEPMISFIMR